MAATGARLTPRTDVDHRPVDRPVDRRPLEAELRELVADLRGVIGELRAENARLRQRLGERPAVVVDLATRRQR